MNCNHKKVILVEHYVAYQYNPSWDSDKGYHWDYEETVEDGKCTQCGQPIS